MFKLFFATPDKKIVTNADLEEITLPGFEGELNILPGHAPLMTTLEAGILRYTLKGESPQKLAISWGYCQVSTDGVTVLAETAVQAEEIDVRVIHDHLKIHEERLIAESLEDSDWFLVQAEIGRLRAELDLINEKNP